MQLTNFTLGRWHVQLGRHAGPRPGERYVHDTIPFPQGGGITVWAIHGCAVAHFDKAPQEATR